MNMGGFDQILESSNNQILKYSNTRILIIMTSLTSLLFQFALAGAVLTALTIWSKRQKNVLWTFLQHFVGVWFIFSGLVKAVDPIGTAYKMQDYFESFEQTFEGLNNMFKGLAPMFPFLAQYSNGFSITMITLEMVLGSSPHPWLTAATHDVAALSGHVVFHLPHWLHLPHRLRTCGGQFLRFRTMGALCKNPNARYRLRLFRRFHQTGPTYFIL